MRSDQVADQFLADDAPARTDTHEASDPRQNKLGVVILKLKSEEKIASVFTLRRIFETFDPIVGAAKTPL